MAHSGEQKADPGLLRKLVQLNPDAILVVDSKGAVRFANSAAGKMLDRCTEDLMGHQFGWPVGDEEPFEIELLAGDGAPRVAEMRVKATTLDGRPAWIVTLRDITERKRAEDELSRTNAALEEALDELREAQQQIIDHERQRALNTMASGIAHDFNNALSTILGFTDLLLESADELPDEETVRKYLQLVRKAASGAAETVRRMRKFYRPRDEYELTSVALNDVAAEAISMTKPRWQTQALAEGATIEVEEDFHDTGLVAGNEPELHEVLTNLIFNAVDAMPEGGTLSLHTRREDDRVLLEVSDTGTGMPEDVRERCLEPFFTTKLETGSGLGLSTVRGIVDRHDGKVTVESEPGEGTTFRILLPAYQTEEKGGEETDRAPRTSERVKVLVVEDEEDQRLLVKEYLEAHGCDVTTAADGPEGVEKFLDGWYNVVITDRAMPGMSGIQVARTIRKRAPEKPIIMLTGFGEMMDAAGETVEDVDVVLSKPVTMKELRNALGEVLKHHE
mgnify:CR=1 FL=1